MKKRKKRININKYIRAKTVRLVGDNVRAGIYSTDEARKIANDLEVDLVEINPMAKPPVCKAMDYNKYLYEQKKREKEMNKKNKGNKNKEIRFTPNISDHDLATKAKKAIEFLEHGDTVTCYVMFRGREIATKERGELVLLKFAELVSDVGEVSEMPKMSSSRKMILKLRPKK